MRPGAITQREEQADADHEQRRLEEVVVEALAGGIEEDDAVGLEDRPDHAAEDRHRAEQLDRQRASERRSVVGLSEALSSGPTISELT